MFGTWKRAVLSCLLLALGAPVYAGGDKIKDDDGLVKVVHVFKKAKPAGGVAGGGGGGYKLAPWKWDTTNPLEYTVYTSSAVAAGLDATATVASLQGGFVAWSEVNSKAPSTASHTNASSTLPDTDTMDNENSILFAPLTEANTIAVTTTWYYSRGPNKGKAVEFDMVFNTNFDWSNSGAADKMDVQNITTHEAGHALGLDHSSTSPDLTMYPYATEGETKKQSLEAGDIAGIRARYP
jgi:hypothetical protein